jgi:ubiquitin C-terminal hydrolase
VEQQFEDNDNYHYQFKNAITSYWDMFSHGLTNHSVFCRVCGNKFEKENPFSKLILYFDEIHHTNNKKGNVCTLGELLENYNRREDVIDDYDCDVCKMKTQATVHNCVRCYPRVLCIALSRGSYLDNKHSIIQMSVDFPFENFKPNDHSQIQDRADDTTYDLVATINHHPGNNQCHYTAICKQHDSGVWYDYNNAEVQRSNFSKIHRGVCKVKVDVQRAATLLFYIRRQPIQVDTSIVSRVDDNNDAVPILLINQEHQNFLTLQMTKLPITLTLKTMMTRMMTVT